MKRKTKQKQLFNKIKEKKKDKTQDDTKKY